MKKVMMSVTLAGLVVIMAGCASSPQRIEAGGTKAVTTMGVDIADFKSTAGAMVKEILVHKRIVEFEDQNDRVPVIEIGSIVNKSDMHIDLAQIAGRINEDLINAGGIVEVIAQDAGAAFSSTKRPKADFLLEGEILVVAARDGRTREKTYTFQLKLNDAKRGTVVWQRTVDVGKQGTSGGVGW